MKKLPQKLEMEVVKPQISPDRFSEDHGKPDRILRFCDPKTNTTWGYVVIDNIHRGPGLGGIRIAPDITLNEVMRLARVMTLKNSVSQLPFGGGKAGLIADPETIHENPDAKAQLIILFAEALFADDGYIPAPDMGTNEHDIQMIYEVFSNKLQTRRHMRGGASRPVEKGGIPIDEWGLTAHGLFAAAQTMEKFERDFEINQSKVVVQGYGNVGSWIATKLEGAGALIAGASDIHTALWNSKGLDIDQLNAIRRLPGGLQNYSGPVEKKFSNDRLDWLLEAPCDLLIPAARPDAITSRNADRLQCRFVLQGANTPSNKMTEYYLENRRKILSLSDLIVNVGGVIGCAVELKMTVDQKYHEMVHAKDPQTYLEDLIYNTVSRNVSEIYERLSSKNSSDTIFREEAIKLAEERLNSKNQECWI